MIPGSPVSIPYHIGDSDDSQSPHSPSESRGYLAARFCRQFFTLTLTRQFFTLTLVAQFFTSTLVAQFFTFILAQFFTFAASGGLKQ